MSWNFNYSLITGIMLCILLGYYAAYPKLPILLSRSFTMLGISEIITLLTDVIASWMDMYYKPYPMWVLYAVNLIYFLFFLTRSLCFYLYTLSLVSGYRRRLSFFSKVGFVVYGVFFVGFLTNSFTGFVFTIDSQGYHAGVGYNYVYVVLFTFLIMGLTLLIRYRRDISDTEFYGLLLSYGILVVGGVCRYLLPHYMLFDTFFMMTIMVLYISIHNSDLYRESRTSSFDYQAFEHVVREHHNYGIWYRIIMIMTNNYSEGRQIYGGVQIDQALNHIGRYLRDSFPEATVFYERSGCFLVMIDNKEQAAKIEQSVMPGVIQRFREPWEIEGTRIYMNTIFGYMDSDLEIESADLELEMIRRLLEQGGNGELKQDFVVDKGVIDDLSHEFAVKKALGDALTKNQVQIYLQPIIEAKTGKVVGAEALSRLSDPQLGLVMPGEFINLAERTGSIIQIGEQVLSRTCQILAEHAEELKDLRFLNINLSPIQCMDHDLADTFDLVPKSYGIDPGKLRLEITEESMVDPNVLKRQMDQLSALGYEFNLDDYGSGYANQFRIKTFPFSGIKLDMKIVWAHFREPDCILPNAVQSFVDRDLSVTAEGVETKEMAEQLTRMGCTYLQGFYYSKPIPVDDFLNYIKAEAK